MKITKDQEAIILANTKQIDGYLGDGTSVSNEFTGTNGRIYQQVHYPDERGSVIEDITNGGGFNALAVEVLD